MISFHYLTHEKIWDGGAQFLIQKLKERSEKKLIFLSGGSVVRLYKTLGHVLREGEIDPSHIAFAQADERFQPKSELRIEKQELRINKDEINSYQIEKTGLWDVCRKKKIPYYLISQEGTCRQSAKGYNEIIKELLGKYPYHLAILGVGEDGHTAGLLPGYERLWNIDRFIVGYEIEKRQNETAVFKKRVTLTPKTLSELDFALVVASGEKKRRAIENAFYPQALLQKIEKVDLFTDIHLPNLLQ